MKTNQGIKESVVIKDIVEQRGACLFYFSENSGTKFKKYALNLYLICGLSLCKRKGHLAQDGLDLTMGLWISVKILNHAIERYPTFKK